MYINLMMNKNKYNIFYKNSKVNCSIEVVIFEFLLFVNKYINRLYILHIIEYMFNFK